ncbi:MAG: four helix bundle protein [Flavobacteriales bacterium]
MKGSIQKKGSGYKDLKVWQKAMRFVKAVYRSMENLPNAERFGIRSQIARAAVSIPCNIAEGWGRNSKKDFIRFLQIARSSALEVETLLIL